MNRYTIEQDGKRYVIEADSEEQAFGLLSQQTQDAPESKEPSPQMRLGSFSDVGKELLRRASARQEELKTKAAGSMVKNLSRAEGMEMALLAVPAKIGQTVNELSQAAPGMAIRSIPPMIGQALGDYTRIPGAPQALGALAGAGGEIAASAYEGKPTTMGRVAEAAGLGAIRGRSTAGSSAQVVMKEANKTATAVALASTAQQLIDEGEVSLDDIGRQYIMGGVSSVASKALDTGKKATKIAIDAADDAVVQGTIRRAHKAGAPMHTSMARLNEVERWSNSMVRQDLGLRKNVPLSKEAIQGAIDKQNKVYQRVADMSPLAKASLEKMKDAQQNSKRLWRQYFDSQESQKPRGELMVAAKEFDAIADVARGVLETEAKQRGGQKLFLELVQARPKLAKAHLADMALNPSRGAIDAKVYGRMLEGGARLDGAAKTIAETFNANLLKERAVGSLMLRELSVTKHILNHLERTRAAQAYIAAGPKFVQRPPFMSEAFRRGAAQYSAQSDTGQGFDMGAVTRGLQSLPVSGFR